MERHGKDLDTLIASIEHAEAIVNRMETSIDNMEEHKIINTVLDSHTFYLKIATVISAIFFMAFIIGIMIVSYYIKEDEKKMDIIQVKLEIMNNRAEFMQETTKLMLDQMIKLQNEHLDMQRHHK